MVLTQRRRLSYSKVRSPAMKSYSYQAPHTTTTTAKSDNGERTDWKDPLPVYSNRNLCGTLRDIFTAIITITVAAAIGERKARTTEMKTKAVLGIALLLLATLTLYSAVVFTQSLLSISAAAGTTEYKEHTLSVQEVDALDSLLLEIFTHSVDGHAVGMEDALHRATQRYCTPYLKHRFRLGRNGLAALESELGVLIDLVASHRVLLGDVAPTQHTIVVGSDGRISFVGDHVWSDHRTTTRDVAQCPLVTAIYELTQGRMHFDIPQKETAGQEGEEADLVMRLTEAELRAKIDDDSGEIHRDVTAIVLRVTGLIAAYGECSSIGSMLSLAAIPAEMELTDQLSNLFKSIADITYSHAKFGEQQVTIDPYGKIDLSDGRRMFADDGQCNQLGATIDEMVTARGYDRVNAAMVSLVAHLNNMDGTHATVQDLLEY